MQQWNDGHDALLAGLRAATSKLVILNNAYITPPPGSPAASSGAGQLFERWGASPDHDGLTLAEDLALLGSLHAHGLTTLSRAGGVKPGSAKKPDPVLCSSGLAGFLIAVTAPGLGFFSCEPDFSSGVNPSVGWMTLLSDPIYSHGLGAPNGTAVAVDTVGGATVMRRAFVSGTVALLDVDSGHGCVQWGDGAVSGVCPT
jgi:hypothetical protein